MGHGMYHLSNDNKINVVGGYNMQLMGGIEEHTEGSGWSKRSQNLEFPRYFFGGCELPESVLSC